MATCTQFSGTPTAHIPNINPGLTEFTAPCLYSPFNLKGIPVSLQMKIDESLFGGELLIKQTVIIVDEYYRWILYHYVCIYIYIVGALLLGLSHNRWIIQYKQVEGSDSSASQLTRSLVAGFWFSAVMPSAMCIQCDQSTGLVAEVVPASWMLDDFSAEDCTCRTSVRRGTSGRVWAYAASMRDALEASQ